MIPDFANKIIESAKVDFGLHLQTEDGWMIVIEGNITVSGPRIAPTTLEVAVAESPLPDALQGVVGQAIRQLLVAREGHLGVQLADRQIGVRADESYEAWHLTGPDGELLVCMPGGKLAHFPPVHHDHGVDEAAPTPGYRPVEEQPGRPATDGRDGEP